MSDNGGNMLFQALQSFAETLKSKFALPGSASPEDQLKPIVSALITSVGSGFGLSVETRTETHLSEHKVRPDIAIYVSGLIFGYVELKAPGLGADAPKLKGDHNKKQWERLRGLPNLIYTDGREWALYRSGERPAGQPVVRLHDEPTEKGKLAATSADADALGRLLRDFLTWKPTVPNNPTGLANYLAPLTRFLRSEVESALEVTGSAIELLANEWRQFFFPDADNAKFADAYAQTVTYAMLLARLAGATRLDPSDAAKTLDKNNGLLARALELLGQPDARKELSVGFAMLQRSLEALDPHDFLKSKPDLWLYFYEDFLAAYDPKLRKNYGVYYTPREVVELQVRLASELLDKRFGKKLGFADEGVVFLDPAMGTGTYPVAAVAHGLEKVRVRSGAGAVPARARQMAENMHGLEILVGPYAVAHLRLTQALEGAMNATKAAGDPEEKLAKRLNIYLADTLESPNAAPPGGLTLTYRALTREHEAARKVKQSGDILVCLGNPPYNRQTIEEGDTTTLRKGGWVRFGDQVKGAAKQEEQGERAIFKDFTEPATKAGAGVHLKNLYNDYVYFWRWALWRLFEKQKGGGIITFITASSFLGGPAFVGMREYMRREFDEIYVINLGGDLLGTRKTPNVFNIQTPVAITLGVRSGKQVTEKPATVKYVRIEADDRKSKLRQLEAIEKLEDLAWESVSSDWMDPFYPRSNAAYSFWPELTNIFPWQHSGVQFKRNWAISETKELLSERLQKLLKAKQGPLRQELYKETDRKISRKGNGADGSKLTSIAELMPQDAPSPSRYSWRQFDRHFAILDDRFADRLRPELINISSKSNIFLATLATKYLGIGSAIGASAAIPDLDFFCGRGGKDIIPLYRDAAGKEPNVAGGLLVALGKVYDDTPTAEDLAAYVYAVLGGQSYTRRFWNELETPGPRVPLTKSGATFAAAVKLGRKLIWLHTYAERLQGEGRGDEIPPGTAKVVRGVSDSPTKYPEAFEYVSASCEVCIGDGRFGPVAPQVWELEVSGLKVVQSWLAYRMKRRAGKKSSPLDEIRPERWTARMSDEFLELLWVLEATLAMEPELEDVLDKVLKSSCFLETELPKPSNSERRAPGKNADDGDQLSLLEDDRLDEEDEN